MSSLMRILIAGTGLMPSDVFKIIADAPRRYKVFQIPKRSGGLREIAQPAQELKLIQRVMLDDVLSRLPHHDAALAYRKKVSVRDNAEVHSGYTSILKMDFANFFSSLIGTDWKKYCEKSEIFDAQDTAWSTRILFRESIDRTDLFLSIGAPTSPTLSNILLYELDTMIADEAKRLAVNYTRYADDITFSAANRRSLERMRQIVTSSLRKIDGPNLQVNQRKTYFISPASRRTVTGVVLTNQGTIGLGREKRRLISAKLHYAINGCLGQEEMIRFAGYLAYVKVVEPEFLEVLTRKYGEEKLQGVIDAAKRSFSIKKRII